MLINKQPQPLLKPIVVKAAAWLCERAHQQACTQVLHCFFTNTNGCPYSWACS